MRTITGSRRKVAATALCATLAVGLTAPPAEAVTERERRVFRMINAARTARGLKALRLDRSLSRKAHRHSARMAERRTLFHPRLTRILSEESWSIAGANVGYGPTLRRVHRAFMRSPGHRANILNPRFRSVGVGVVRRHGYFWVTQVFYG